jgi:hypothetical protein
MSRDKKTMRSYRLLSAYMMLEKSNKIEQEATNKFNLKLKGFHIFCTIIFAAFLIDGYLPYLKFNTKIVSVHSIHHESKQIITKTGVSNIKLPTLIEIVTKHGAFITSDIKGAEHTGEKVIVCKTPLFSVIQNLEYESGFTAQRYFNYYGRLIFWPILSLLFSLSFLLIKRFYGSNTISVLVLLNIVPFFVVLYMT